MGPAGARDADADIRKSCRDRRMRFVHGHQYAHDCNEAVEHGIGHRPRRGLDQSIAAAAKCLARHRDDLIITHGMRQLIQTRRLA